MAHYRDVYGSSSASQTGGSFWDHLSNIHNTYGLGKLWNDITGVTNTTTQNSAAAALQEDSQAFSASEAQKERDWQTMMSNTAYQRGMADLSAAGLNPALVTGAGAQATSGQGAFASSGVAGTQASNVNALASLGTAAAGIGILIKAIKAAAK